MLKIGVTGNIATGKTTVTEMLKEMGIPVVSSDELVRKLQAPGNVLWRYIKESWGDELFNEDGTLNREAVASKLLEDNIFKKQLEEIAHPLVKEEIIKAFTSWEKEGRDMAVAEVPLLFETGWEDMFDSIILTYAPEGTQVRRVVLQRNISNDTAVKWIKVQGSQEEKKKKADIVIDTGKSIDQTKKEVFGYIEEIRKISLN
jgi:dephospho-CoA kinase